MLKKDYLMRLVQAFFDAIHQIVNRIDRDDIDGAKTQIEETYALLGKNADYFRAAGVEDILNHLKSEEGDYLKRVELLARLMYLEAKIQNQNERKKQLLEKVKVLLEHHKAFSKEYSFEINRKLSDVYSLLEQL